MLENESEALKTLSIRTQVDGRLIEQNIDIIKIDYFNAKQVLHRYKVISNIYKTDARGKTKKKLCQHLLNTDNSILRIPFFFRYTDDLFNNIKNNMFDYLTREEGIDTVVKTCIEKEWGLFTETEENKNLELLDYKREMMSFLGIISFSMYKENNLTISYEEFEKINCKYNTEKERLLLVRLTKDGQDHFRFQHKLFYEYFLTYYIIFNTISTKERVFDSLNDDRNFLGFNNSNKLPDIIFRKRIYSYFLSDKYYNIINSNIKSFSKDGIIYSNNSTDMSKLLEADIIEIKDIPLWNIDQIIVLLPLIKSLSYNKFKLNDYEDLVSYVDDKEIILNQDAFFETTGAESFGKLKLLDTTEGIIEIDKLRNFDDIYKIAFLINKMNDFDKIDKTLASKYRLLINVEPKVLPELIQKIVNENCNNVIYSFQNTIKKHQINETFNENYYENEKSIENIIYKMMFLEQLYFVETYCSRFVNEDTEDIQSLFYELYINNHELVDKIMNDILQKRRNEYNIEHPYFINLLSFITNSQYQLSICY